MKILIKPSDIIERCLWDNFSYYILSSDVDKKKFIKENIEFEISENDALVIGLIKCLYTNNLIHKFNEYMTNYLQLKSVKGGDILLVKKKNLFDHISKFMNKFPTEWKPIIDFEISFKELEPYISQFVEKVSNLDIIDYTDNMGTYECLNSTHVKKCIVHHN